jgi:hypothetical protein
MSMISIVVNVNEKLRKDSLISVSDPDLLGRNHIRASGYKSGIWPEQIAISILS